MQERLREIAKEILLGLAIAVVIFLAINGVNVTPIIIFVVLIGSMLFLMQGQGQIALGNTGKAVAENSLVQFDEIGGQDSAIKELKEALQFVLKPEEIGYMGIRPLKGILLVGPPGTGKTLMARAAAGFTSSSFIAASGREVI